MLAGSLVLAAAAAGLDPGQDLGRTQTIQFPDDVRMRDGALVDVDADGLYDLVAGTNVEDPRRPRRLRVYLRRKAEPPFAHQPDFEVELTPEVVAYAVGDVHPDPGGEVILFTSEAVFIWRPKAPNDRQRIVLLARMPFFWQMPDGSRTRTWQAGVRDLDGDGDVDLLLPEVDGYRALFQRRGDGVDFEASLLRAPVDPEDVVIDIGPTLAKQSGQPGSSDSTGEAQVGGSSSSSGGGISMMLQFDTEVGHADPLLAVSHELPVPEVLDWNGDGRVDVLAQGRRQLWVWVQREDGGFAEAPLRLDLPVERDRKREFDISFSAHAAHLDDDERADYLLIAGDKRSEKVRTQVLVYSRRAGEAQLFAREGMPEQLLVLAGFAGAPRLFDVDSDGRLDLIVGAFRPDLLDAIRSATSKELDAQMHMYRNVGGTFSKNPDLTWTVSVPLEGERFNARFFGDVTGDGVSEILLRDRAERVSIYMPRVRDGSWSVFDKPVWELNIDPTARLVIVNGTAAQAPEFLVLEDRNIVHVRFR